MGMPFKGNYETPTLPLSLLLSDYEVNSPTLPCASIMAYGTPSREPKTVNLLDHGHVSLKL